MRSTLPFSFPPVSPWTINFPFLRTLIADFPHPLPTFLSQVDSRENPLSLILSVLETSSFSEGTSFLPLIWSIGSKPEKSSTSTIETLVSFSYLPGSGSIRFHAVHTNFLSLPLPPCRPSTPPAQRVTPTIQLLPRSRAGRLRPKLSLHRISPYCNLTATRFPCCWSLVGEEGGKGLGLVGDGVDG
jgi:hypothetical protein